MGNLFKNGDISRWIRLITGVGGASYGLYAGDYFLLMLGVVAVDVVPLQKQRLSIRIL